MSDSTIYEIFCLVGSVHKECANFKTSFPKFKKEKYLKNKCGNHTKELKKCKQIFILLQSCSFTCHMRPV